MKHLLSLTVALIVFTCTTALGQVTGKWKTIDDETGKAKSIVEITESNGKYYGTIIQLFRGSDEDQDPVCKVCPGDRKNKKIIGMQIVRDMKKAGSEYKGGTIMDPKTGKVYECKMWKEGNNLKVRGYLYFLYRTQTWLPAN